VNARLDMGGWAKPPFWRNVGSGRYSGKNLTLQGDLHVGRWTEPGWAGYWDQ